MNDGQQPLSDIEGEPPADEGRWTMEELRLLAGLKDSTYWPPMQRALDEMRSQDSVAVLDSRTDFAQTQYHRGRLQMLKDLIFLLYVDAPQKVAELERKAVGKDDDG